MIPASRVTVGELGDSPELSAELLALIREGRKRAGASLLWSWEAEGETLPEPGDFEIVLDHQGRPALVTRIKEVDIVAFDEVGPEFAAREGEGDQSLDHWRAVHRDFFERECRRLGRRMAPDIPVVCITFDLEHVVRR